MGGDSPQPLLEGAVLRTGVWTQEFQPLLEFNTPTSSLEFYCFSD
jgi:hypothetical protein